jgi:hypothetical protein
MQTEPYETFPWWMVAVCNSVGLAIYALGFCLMARVGLVWAMLYIAYCASVECRVLAGSCRSCCYYGKRCGFGKGWICSWFLTQKPNQDFAAKQISWWSILPDFLVSLVPLVVGLAILIRSFSWLVLVLVLLLIFLGSIGTAFVRTQLACKYCQQRLLGCPAERLFDKGKQG